MPSPAEQQQQQQLIPTGTFTLPYKDDLDVTQETDQQMNIDEEVITNFENQLLSVKP
ncbi:1703_t:CDS:2 [Funneliformis caledonium]|uniref:1703_t:CDS:1 n=2 Tax=Funneliformis TaxID=1117308 RepID=A0A9N8W197_9GLOM|nr:1703_t:CDS:2 [Funneliformis caledonium]CAG8535629.1 9735_t:CDS:2 [Funneliformis mosseae]